jgi:hypothetical protein
MACPASDVCGATQACGIDPASTWEVLPTSAAIAPDNNGFAWDSLSDPDAEIGLWCPSNEANVSAVMPKVSNDFNPTWSTGGCLVTASALMADGLGFDALEIDTTSYDVISPFTVVPITEADLRAGTKIVGPSGGLDSMTLRFTKQ